MSPRERVAPRRSRPDSAEEPPCLRHDLMPRRGSLLSLVVPFARSLARETHEIIHRASRFSLSLSFRFFPPLLPPSTFTPHSRDPTQSNRTRARGIGRMIGSPSRRGFPSVFEFRRSCARPASRRDIFRRHRRSRQDRAVILFPSRDSRTDGGGQQRRNW